MPFTNLDGVQAEPLVVNCLPWLQERGYAEQVPLRGVVGFTELAMHCQVTERVGIVAFTNKARTYAFVLLDDGSFIDGCFDLRADGTFSVS